MPNLLVGLFGETGLSGCSLEYSSSAAQAEKEVYTQVTDSQRGLSWNVAKELHEGAHAACHFISLAVYEPYRQHNC